MSGCGSLAAGVGAELALEFPSTKGELRCPRGHSTPGMRDAEVGQDQSKCHWAKLGPAVYPKKIILCLCDFYFSHLCLCNRRQNQKPALCQLCLNCAAPHVVTSDPGHDLPASVPKNFNSTAMMAFAEVKVEGRNLTL